MGKTIKMTRKELVKVYKEWERQFRRAPDGFQQDAAKVMTETCKQSAKEQAKYFLGVLRDVRREQR